MTICEPAYMKAHDLVTKQYGPAREYDCVDCGKPARDWSFNYSADVEVETTARGAPYSFDPAAYEPRCSSCHMRYDMAQDERVKEAMTRGQRRGNETQARLRATDPEWAENEREKKRAAAHRKRACLECRLSANPGNLAQHQRATGHVGRV
jgi:hypothetical protein